MSDEKPAPQPRLTAAKRANITKWASNGMPLELVAQMVGVEESTIRVWRSKNKAFDTEVRSALALAESILVAKVRTGAPSWRAAAWMLERLYPERYGPPNNGDGFVPPHSGVPASADDQAGL